LDDTIDENTGFKFEPYSSEALLEAVGAALEAFRRKDLWIRMMKLGMSKDFSWRVSAAEYAALYRRLAG
jgi:starch synthase